MKILLIAPHPFYQERGTPIAIDLLLKVLAERGDHVDVLTYHEGKNVMYNGEVKIHRICKPPFANGIKPGFSFKKVICDRYMLSKALSMAGSTRYDIVHAVEESVFIAMLLRRRYGIRYVYDMDSSMPMQIADKFPFMFFLMPLMSWFERCAVRKALVVVPMCDSLAKQAERYGAGKVTVLRDISMQKKKASSPVKNLREELGIKGVCFLYLGNLEKYQGIDLLLRSFAILLKQSKEADLVIAGGYPDDISKYKVLAARLGVGDKVHFVGPKPLDEMGALFESADVLVSPRTKGRNTPMKIYSYLGSGKAILATRLPTHTQVLDDTVSVLASPEPEAFAKGMNRLLQDSGLRRELGENARKLAEKKYSFDVYRQTVLNLYNWIQNSLTG